MTAAILIRALGPVQVWRDGERQAVGSPQQQAVLATLLLRGGHPAGHDDLIHAVWGDDPPRAAISTIRTYVYRLRRLFDGSVVTISNAGGGYAMDTGAAAVDVHDFRAGVTAAEERVRAGDDLAAAGHLTRALQAWAGTALAGVPGRYADGQRARLTEMRLAAEELAFTVGLRTTGAGPADLARLAGLVVEHPLREGIRSLLMLALYQGGRQAEALEVFQEGRRLLADELGLEPGPALQEMQQRILRGDPALPVLSGEDRAETATPVAGPVRPAPTYLPADLPDFTGRDAELAMITGALTEEGATVALTGLAGIGRTTTAVRAAHLLAGEFRDGRLYANLSDGADIAELLLTWLRLFGVDGPWPTTATGRATLLRTAVADRRPLIVLDDVTDPAQVALVRSAVPRAAVLITSARRFPNVAGATWVMLGGFSEDEALLLMERIAGPQPILDDVVTARYLLGLCDGYPLAIRVGAERVARRPYLPLRAFADEFEAEMHDPRAEQHVECVIAEAAVLAAYERLRPLPARLLRLLTVMPECTADLAETAALLGVGTQGALSAVDVLTDLHLVTEMGADGRYRLESFMVWAVARRKLYELHTEEEITSVGAALVSR
ncbi:AfsR/SARP family transcriptional regulator [Actinoplanes rectilineatus]|uniref:AfsR/SARP family transcriptional regulator n=1 Tax=Actinoplanes rectilineatus TaxID=113571 RepID=UPI00069822C3|nr:AfsR/SARP family transcriptional regulator [Actinoplanes rectilineatus]